MRTKHKLFPPLQKLNDQIGDLVKAYRDEGAKLRTAIAEIQEKVVFSRNHSDDLGRTNTLQAIGRICDAALAQPASGGGE